MISEQLVECVPNFSEGRRLDCVDSIVDCFMHRTGVKLLDYTHDTDHNRMVVTAVGNPQAMKEAMLDAIGVAVERIDLNLHTGEHPRLGAADVIPFIPIKNMTMEEAVALARAVGWEASKRYDLPVYLYEEAASAPHRQNLAEVRKGGFEHLQEKMQQPGWLPDFGPNYPHPTAGASIIGARHFLVAYNINLRSNDLEMAKAIARSIRFSSGGFPYCKALGLRLESLGMVQVSINLTNIEKTTLHQVFDKVKEEAARYGVSIANSELIGLMPLQALVDTTAHYIQLSDFSADRVLEHAIWNNRLVMADSALIALIIFIITYLGIIFTRLPGVNVDRPSAAYCGAIAMVLLGVLTPAEAVAAIDTNTIFLLLGMMIVIATLQLDGFFDLIAKKTISYSKTRFRLLCLIVFVTGISSAFLVNDAVVLMFTPVIIQICRSSKPNPVPYLIGEILASNIGSVMTITGNPQNMLIGLASGISYGTFLLRLLPVSLIGLLLTVGILRLLYRTEFGNKEASTSASCPS